MEHLPLIYRVPFAVFHLNHHQNTAPRRRISQPLAEPRCSARPCSSRASCICWGRWMVWSKGWCGGTSILGNLHIYIYWYIYIYEYYYIYMSIIIYIDIMLVKQSFTTHIWWYIPSIYGDLGDGLLLFYILPTLLAFLKRYWRILYASVRSIICLCIYWYTAMAFNTVTTSTTYRYHSIQYHTFMEDIFTVCFLMW